MMASDPKSQYQQEFYFVAYPFVELPELKSLEREFAESRRVRFEIIETIRVTRAKRREVVEKLKPLFAEEKACKERCNEISKRLSELQFNFKNVRVRANASEDSNTFKSEAEIDREVRKLEAQIKGGRNTRAEENHLLKQIKDLERSRGQNLSIEDWNLKKKLKDIWNVKKELRELDFEVSSLENDLQYYSNWMDEVYPSLQQLRTQRYQNNKLCLQMRSEMDDAIFEYLANPNPSALEDRSRLEVEKFMRLWNGNKEFREEYEQRKLRAQNAQYAP